MQCHSAVVEKNLGKSIKDSKTLDINGGEREGLYFDVLACYVTKNYRSLLVVEEY